MWPLRQRDLVLAAEISEDIGWDRLERGGDEFVALREELARELATTVEGTVLPAAERVRAGVLLGTLGDPRPGVYSLPPAMVPIAGGRFVIGEGDEQADLSIERFEIARYPVTNAQWKLFVKAGGYRDDQLWWDQAGNAWLRQSGTHIPRFWNNDDFGIIRPNHPVVGVSWYETMAFCRWLTQTLNDGYTYTLPTEAEWEYAARGAELREYPWGPEDPDGERANFGQTHNGTTAVGCFPRGATPEGVHDMAGNIWEWTRSEYKPYPYDPADGREDSTEVEWKMFTRRGGSWNDHSIDLRASYRNYVTPDYRSYYLGFRLARHLKV